MSANAIKVINSELESLLDEAFDFAWSHGFHDTAKAIRDLRGVRRREHIAKAAKFCGDGCQGCANCGRTSSAPSEQPLTTPARQP